MTVQRILIVSGTHGNEINPVWAVKQFNRKENSLNNGIEYEYIIGNPAAYEKGCRYIDVDLNRSFKESENFDQHKNSFYETNRANFLVDEFGIDGSKPCQIAIDSLREEIDKLKNNLIELPKELVVHVHQGSVDYPRDEKGYIDGLIHPERINQDWKMIKKGDPLFLDSQGIVHKYDGDQLIWPVFIGEVAYKEKKIAMSYTKKEVICSKKQWVQEFESF